MEDLYSLLIEKYSLESILWKNKYLLYDMGTYHAFIYTEPDKKVEFYNLNGVLETMETYQTNQDLISILDIFKENKENDSSNLEFDELDLDTMIEEIDIKTPFNSHYKFKIYTYGCRNYNPSEYKFDLTFDLSKYRSYIPKSFQSFKYYRGTDTVIQKMIVKGYTYEYVINKIIKEIEENKPVSIGIFCSHGKHRSVGMAEILKNYYYRKVIINHLCLQTFKRNTF